MFGTVAAPIKKTERMLASYTLKNYVGHIGIRPGPSQVMLFLDGDDTGTAGTDNPNNNWPDPGNNHGTSGLCMNFLDGHAEFVKTINYLNVLNPGQDGNQAVPTGLQGQ